MKLRLLSSFVLSLAFALGTPALRGQTHAPEPPAQHETGKAQSEAAPAHAPEGAAAHGGGGSHGPAVTLFGRELSPRDQFLVRLVNFAIFFAILYFALRGILSSAFRLRARDLEERLRQAELDRLQGEALIRDMEARMAGLQQELDGFLAKAEVDAESERQRILDAARLEAAAILAQARQDIDTHRRQIEQELRALVADLAVEGARTRLQTRLQGQVAQDVLDRAITRVGGAQ
jgi:F-type H+-transporting ATPase subunit b